MTTADTNLNYASQGQPDPKPGPFIAKVISNIDPTYMGILEVEILRPSGATASAEGQLHQVKYMSPFWGVTSSQYTSPTDDYNNTQKSYGMWMVPPDVGSYVMIIFIDGDPKRGYWIGCVGSEAESMNFMMPGIAATQRVVEDVDPDNASNYGRVPVAEYNKKVDDNEVATDPTRVLKPQHPLAKILAAQGLIFDDIRGITTSSARRESPSMVFGISTPGPLDKNGKTGPVGKAEHLIPNYPVSRLGGTTFVMDDGDDKFLRMTAPTDGPPVYASVENGDTSGDNTRPHNELVRIRTRTGHEILLHNSEDLIYITNSRGTAWIELTSDGKIDIYAQDSISVRSQNDINFYADRDINMECGRNFNLKVAERHQTEVGGDKITIVNGNVAIKVDGTQDETVTGAVAESYESTFDLTTGDATNITTGGALNLKVSGASVISSSGDFTIKAANTAIDGGNINFNSGIAGAAGSASPATAPDPLPTIDNPTETDGVTLTSILARVPTTEPYPHHENLDATMFKPSATDREAATAIPVPNAWKTYTTTTDTFTKNRENS
jgi:Uncharacterized protein conserved in bacteria (DUF2345)